MSVATIESELTVMTDAERRSIIDIATGLIAKGQNPRRLALEEKRRLLKASAEHAVELYRDNKELTIWTALDSEDFVDAER